jgi:hypothetical protein
MSTYVDKTMTITSNGYEESQRIRDLMTQATIEFEAEREDVRFSELVVKTVGRSRYNRRLVLTVKQQRFAR